MQQAQDGEAYYRRTGGVRALDACQPSTAPRMPELVAADFYVDRMLQHNPDDRPFLHPFYWAAFGMTGV